MARCIKVIAIVDEEQKRLLYHILLDEKKSFAEWLREQMNAYIKANGKRRRKGGPMTIFGGGNLPGEEEASRVFIKRNKELFSQGERLLRLAFSFKPNITMKRDEVQFFQAVIGLCSKSIKTFRGIHLLCSRGICEDAMAMSRTLLEMFTSITHLKAGDRKANAARFWEFMALKHDELGRLLEKVPDAKPDPTVPEDNHRDSKGSRCHLRTWT